MPPARPLALALLLAGCSAPPDMGPVLRTAQVPSTAVPVILPLDQVLAQAQAVQITPATTSTVSARAARLRARAAAMQGPVQDEATRARLAAALASG